MSALAAAIRNGANEAFEDGRKHLLPVQRNREEVNHNDTKHVLQQARTQKMV